MQPWAVSEYFTHKWSIFPLHPETGIHMASVKKPVICSTLIISTS